MLFNRKSKTIRISKIVTFCALFFTSIVFFSCALTLRSPYDAYTDQIMMQLFTEIETFFQTIDRYSGPPECEYDSNKDFYLRINVQCEVLLLRNKSRQDNIYVYDAIKEFKDTLNQMEKLHKKTKCLDAEVISAVHSHLKAIFEEIMQEEDMRRYEA